MSDQSDFNKEDLKKKFKILLDQDNEIKKWNEDLFIKTIILSPIIIFIIGYVLVNRPEDLIDVLFTFLYLLLMVSIGLIILFFMITKLK